MAHKPIRYTGDMIKNYFESKYWTSDTTSSLWNYNATVYPNDEAYVEKGGRYTWSKVKIMSDILAQFLIDTGFRRDDLLFMLLPNITESYVLRAACEKAGVLCCTALMTLGENEISYIMERYRPIGIAVPLRYRSMNYYDYIERNKEKMRFLQYVLYLDEEVPAGSISLRKILQAAADNKLNYFFDKSQISAVQVSVIGFTSGTTGMPKAVEHAQCARMALARAYRSQLDLKKNDVVLNITSAVAGLGAAVCYNGSTALVGAKSVILDKWGERDTLELIQKEKVSVLLAVPAQLAQLAKSSDLSQYDLQSLRVISSSTAALSSDLSKQLENTFGVPIVNTYGQFDGGLIAQTNVRDSANVRYNTVGTPPEGMIVKLLNENGIESNEGEIVYSGPTTAGGYYKDSEATISAWGSLGLEGSFKSGDLGKWDNEGKLKIIGRLKNVIIRGGQNIYPSEIEGLLMTHPKVKEVAIIPMVDEIMGEKLCAYVSTFDNYNISLDEITGYLERKKIAKYKYPERLEIISELPKIGAQKIDIKKLTQDINKKIKGEVV